MTYIKSKPWGDYEVLYNSTSMVVKMIHVNPGQRLSLQKHKLRSENWIVLKGQPTIQVYVKRPLIDEALEGYSCYIKKNTWHRLSNKTNKHIYILEVQRGICSEDDIIRREDDYGRI